MEVRNGVGPCFLVVFVNGDILTTNNCPNVSILCEFLGVQKLFQ